MSQNTEINELKQTISFLRSDKKTLLIKLKIHLGKSFEL